MRSLAAVAALCAGASVAFAKAPKASDEASVEDLVVAAKGQLEGAKKGEHNKWKDAVDKYRDKSKSQLADWKDVVEIVNDSKTPEAQQYRDDATAALIERFADVNEKSDPLLRATKREVAMALLDLMKADPKKDGVGLLQIDKLLNTWWHDQYTRNWQFHTKDPPDKRAKSYAKAKAFLKQPD